MKVPELKEKLAALGVEVPSGAKKADLEALLEKHSPVETQEVEEETLGVEAPKEESSEEERIEKKLSERKKLGFLGSQPIVRLRKVEAPSGEIRNEVLTASGVTYNLSDRDFENQHTA